MEGVDPPAVAANADASNASSVTLHVAVLNQVESFSSHQAWAVGQHSAGRATHSLIDHWNGSTWRAVPAPSPTGPSTNVTLAGVAQASANSAWAVGSYGRSSLSRHTFILHWNGSVWKELPSPSPGADAFLESVAATSDARAWAVGYALAGGVYSPVIERWDGTSWTLASSPSPNDASLYSVAATSASDAWAVGRYVDPSHKASTLILHWNGSAWSQVPSPNPPNGVALYSLVGVAATSASNAWAVGNDASGVLALRWNGSSWIRVATPSPPARAAERLFGVAVTSKTDGWAAGSTYNRTSGHYATLILHWDGHAWKRVASPNQPSALGGGNQLFAVSANSRKSAWAVGYYNGKSSPASSYTLSVRWNGVKWKHVTSP